MTTLNYNNKSFRVLDEFGFKESNNEVTFNDITVDFTNCSLADMPFKYQEIELLKDNNIIFTGYVDTIEVSTMKAKKEFRELTLTILSPLKMATVRTISLIGTYTKEEAITRVLQPLVNDGFTIEEINIADGQITTNFVLETIENAMNTICSKLNVFWYIDEHKKIYVYSIDYMFGRSIVKTITENDKFGDLGFLGIVPAIENVDYANVINFKNVRLYYQSSGTDEDFPILNLPKTVNKGDIVTFNNPIVIDENTLKSLYEDGSITETSELKALQLIVGTSSCYYNQYDANTSNSTYGQYLSSDNVGFSDDSGDEKIFVLQRDSFFSNLITGFKWNGADNSQITYIYAGAALRYTTVKFMYTQEIENLKGIISDSGQIEKTIDYNEQWTSANKIIDYGRSLITQNSNVINSVTLEFDKDPNLKIGDIVNIQMPSFFVEGNFAVKEIDYTYKNEIEQNWKITLKSADLVSTYIDIFRPTETQESEDSVDTVILSEFVEENIFEKHTAIVEENNEN